MTENRMKRKKTGMIWLIFTIIWMSVIFSFSAKKAVESEGMSHSVGKEIGRLIVPQFTSWSEERQEQFAKMIDFPVRKCAHATEYAVLGVLILRTAYSFLEDSGKRSMLICWCAVLPCMARSLRAILFRLSSTNCRSLPYWPVLQKEPPSFH